jgi:hypothetical protein
MVKPSNAQGFLHLIEALQRLKPPDGVVRSLTMLHNPSR